MDLHLRHIVNDLQRMLQRTLPRGIEIQADLGKSLWMVPGDPTQLYQMLMNLCVNARDAMPAGGRLKIAAANTLVTEADCAALPGAKPGRYVRLTVTDTGTGIPPEIQERIFDPFFTTKEYGKGTGLGLATVLGIVKGHQGVITVNSAVNKGTQFQVLLPATVATEVEASEAKSAPSPASRGQMVLVVDDEAPIRQLNKVNLESKGYRVLTARDGEEAVALYFQHQQEIQLVLTDMMMPRLDGVGLAKAVQALNPRARIIACSGLSGSIDAADKTGAVFHAVLVKPYSAELLFKTVSEVLLRA
jgi:CheY-like chemotaxis protein